MSKCPALLAGDRQRLRHVRRFHEAEAQRHAREGLADRLDAARARPGRRAACRRGLDGQDDVLLVQHLVVLEAVHAARSARSSGSLVRNTAVPGTRCGGFFSSIATSRSSGISCRRVFSNSRRVPRRQVYITHHHQAAERERHPAALDDLEQIGAEEGQVDEQERHHQRGGRPRRPAPDLPDHDEGQHARSPPWCRSPRCRRRRRARSRSGTSATRSSTPTSRSSIDARHVNLARCASEVWRISRRGSRPSWIACWRERIGAGDDRLAGDHGGGRGEHHHRQQRPVGIEQEERILDRLRDRPAPARPGRDS